MYSENLLYLFVTQMYTLCESSAPYENIRVTTYTFGGHRPINTDLTSRTLVKGLVLRTLIKRRNKLFWYHVLFLSHKVLEVIAIISLQKMYKYFINILFFLQKYPERAIYKVLHFMIRRGEVQHRLQRKMLYRIK